MPFLNLMPAADTFQTVSGEKKDSFTGNRSNRSKSHLMTPSKLSRSRPYFLINLFTETQHFSHEQALSNRGKKQTNCLLQAETSRRASTMVSSHLPRLVGLRDRKTERGRERSIMMIGYEMDILIGLSCSLARMGRISPLCKTHTNTLYKGIPA